MRRLALLAIGIMALLITGCIRKGPYYIYGDYIEDLQEEGVPAEETPTPSQAGERAKPAPQNVTH